MNAISLYITTSRLVFQNDEKNSQDLYRLLPYLRQSLCCSVCRNLLLEPYTPSEANCQHHVCKQCVGERKKLKPTCTGCKDYNKYDENTQLRILLQCYKNLCEYIKSQPMFLELKQQADAMNMMNGSSPNVCNSFVDLIEEGARFEDSYKFSSGLSKSAYSILPCIYPTIPSAATSSSNAVPISQSMTTNNMNYRSNMNNNAPEKLYSVNRSQEVLLPKLTPPIKTLSTGSTMYSVQYAGNGNKITIKRKVDANTPISTSMNNSLDDDYTTTFKKPMQQSTPTVSSPSMSSNKLKIMAKRKGCRCGNATTNPGKLTCCGQRCPCYVDSKSCIDCKCRGCRNPHRADGLKVRPHIPELQNLELNLNNTSNSDNTISLSNINLTTLNTLSSSGSVSSNSNPNPGDSFSYLDTTQSFSAPFSNSLAGSTIQVVGVYTTHMPDVTCSPTLSNLIMRDQQQQSTTLDANLMSATNLMTISSAPQELLFNTGAGEQITLNPNNLIIDSSALDDNIDV